MFDRPRTHVRAVGLNPTSSVRAFLRCQLLAMQFLGTDVPDTFIRHAAVDVSARSCLLGILAVKKLLHRISLLALQIVLLSDNLPNSDFAIFISFLSYGL